MPDLNPEDPPAPRLRLRAAAAPDGPTTEELEALGNLDASGRVGRTAAQVGIPFALVTLGSWAARLAELDLDPGPGADLPAEVAGAWVAVVAYVLARRMNRPSS